VPLRQRGKLAVDYIVHNYVNSVSSYNSKLSSIFEQACFNGISNMSNNIT